MKLYELSVFKPIAISMVFLAVIVFGIFSLTRLPVDLFPEMDPPVITVITNYSGVSALEVEQNVTEELENSLSMIPNLDEINSESLDNVSVITLEFNWGVEMLEVADDVRDAISRARQLLPEDIDEPIVQKFDAGAIPVVILSVTAEESFNELENLLEDELVTPLNRVNGVGAVNIAGAPVQEIHIRIDPIQFEAYNLDIAQIAQVIGAENVTVPAGRLDLGPLSYNLRTNNEFNSLEEIGDVVVAYDQGRSVYLHEIATIVRAFEDEESISRVNGGRGVTVMVNKQSDANTVSVASAVLEQLPALQENLPEDVQVEILLDTSEFILNSINNLSSVLFYGILFVIIVVLAFLHSWRSTFIVGITIPVSLVMAFIYLTLTGSTLNIISLSSMAIALGMVVDDAIVVLENVMRRVEEGDDPREAAIRGTREVFTAVIASTLTVVAVFLPLTFVTGMMGVWFQELGFIVVITITGSTISALMLTPMLSSLLIRRASEQEKGKSRIRQKFTSFFNRHFEALESRYGTVIDKALIYRKTVAGGAAALFIASLFLLPMIGTEFMPVSDNSQIMAEVELATGRSLDFTGDVVQQVEEIFIDEVPEIRSMSVRAGGTGFGGGADPLHLINANLQLVDLSERSRSIFEIAEILRNRLSELPEINSIQVEAGGGGVGSARPVEIHISGESFTTTTALAEELMNRIENVEGLRDVSMSRGEERPEFELNLDRNKLAAAGLNSSTVSTAVRGMMDGLIATQYRESGDEYDVILRYREEDRHSLASLESMSVMTPEGEAIRVADLGTLREVRTPPNIERMDRQRVITVSSGLEGRALNEAVVDIEQQLDLMDIPGDVTVTFGGDVEEQAEAFGDLFLILLLSVLLVYIVMAAQFESLKDPLVIMFSIPFALPGVLISFLLTGTAISVIGFLGGVILVGIVVKNAIVLIDYIRLMQEEGRTVHDSIVEAGKLRLRPILMTTLTTVLAMIPLALSIGEGAEIWSPMAIAVVGGLTFSTLVTLGLIPVMYAIFNRKQIAAEQAG